MPVVAIVGRPNVGKSSLFNALTGRRTSIVEATPGVTRDRITDVCEAGDTFFELVDTGGFGIEDKDDLTEHVERQIAYAIEQADLILFVVDTRDGIVPLDGRMAEILRKHHDRVWLIANKTDEPHMSALAAEFGRLGFGEPFCVSAAHGLGREVLKERLAAHLAGVAHDAPSEAVMKIAIVGKRNVGKSTMVNALAKQERMIVSEVPGTTRDSVDVRFDIDGRSFVAIDTAGLRKRTKLADSIEYFAFTRAENAIERADVVLLMLDATEPTSQVDKKLASFLMDAYKPVVIVVNKWDLAKEYASTEAYGDYLTKTLIGLDFAPVVFTTAKAGKNVFAAIDVASSLFKQYQTRVSTGQLNSALEKALAERGPSHRRGTKPPKIFYATQVTTAPPTIVLFVNTLASFRPDYLRFLIHRFRETLPFPEIPIRLVLRAKQPDEKGTTRARIQPARGPKRRRLA